MNATEQMTLGFEGVPQGTSVSKATSKAKTTPPSHSPASVAVKDALTHEAMAQVLAAHPDYKILRRLVPRDDWGNVPAGETRRVIVLDTETTGLDVRRERIIELAMLSVLVDTATGLPVGPVSTYESFEDPGQPIPAAITEITGIDDSMVRGQRIDEPRVIEMVQAADLIVAHNAGFDRPFTEARLRVFAERPWNCSFAGIDWKQQGSGSAKLEFLAHERGWFYDAHRALVDCHALLQVLAAPLKDGQTGLARLLSGTTQSRFRLSATGAPFESKDALKSRGYRWDTEGRVWWSSLAGKDALDEELVWLKDQVYGSRKAQLLLEEQTSQVMFSQRKGLISSVSI